MRSRGANPDATGSGRPLRVLTVAYDFPPHAAIGTMRTLRLVRHLHEAGSQVTVLTSSPATYLPGTPVDVTLEAQVAATVRIIRARNWRIVHSVSRVLRRVIRSSRAEKPAARPGADPPKRRKRSSAPRRLADWMDAALTIPDKESSWMLPATLKGLWQLVRHRPDVIYSSAPPWTGHVIALLLATVSGRPWVADFRDPWARAPGRSWGRAFRQRAAARLERLVIRRADAVLFVTRANLADYAAVHGDGAARKFHLVPNGCDPDLFAGVTGTPPQDRFVLLHAGSFYGPRNPAPVLYAIARAVARGAIAPATFALRLIGDVSLGMDLQAECGRLGIQDLVQFVPRMSRSDALREMRMASALLLVQTGTTMSVPGKAYEYLAAGRPVFALSEEGETAEIVRASGIGVSVTPDSAVEVAEAALLELMALAQRPYYAPPRLLYDGRVHAATAAQILMNCARPRRTQGVEGSASGRTVSSPPRTQETER